MIAWIRRFRTTRRWSLRYKFIATLAVFTVALSASFGWISAQRLEAELKGQVLQRGYTIARQLADSLADPANRTSEQLFRLLFYYLIFTKPQGSDLLYIQLVKEGETAAIPTGIETVLGLAPLELDVTERVVERRWPDTGTPYLDLIVAVTGPGARVIWQPGRPARVERVPPAYVRLGLSLAYVESVMRRELLRTAALSLLYILVGLGLAFWLYKSILGPIEALTESVKRFKDDRHARAHVRTGDELQTLAEEFNRMAEAIQERDERLERVNERLRRANRVKSEFLAVMGHELKTPLHAIRGYAQLLLEGIDGPVTPEQREDLENILKSSDHLRELIDNVLQFSKLESGEEALHPTRVAVRPLLEEALQNVKVLARGKALTVQIHAADGLTVEADETKLKQVLINLLSNALKYTPRGRVTVRAEPRDGEVLFTVQDTGVGIPPEALERVFEPFTQLDSSDARPWGGLGLGLSIVKRYVEMHGGRVWVESAPGRGSTFYVSIPQPPRASTSTPTLTGAGANSNGERREGRGRALPTRPRGTARDGQPGQARRAA